MVVLQQSHAKNIGNQGQSGNIKPCHAHGWTKTVFTVVVWNALRKSSSISQAITIIHVIIMVNVVIITSPDVPATLTDFLHLSFKLQFGFDTQHLLCML